MALRITTLSENTARIGDFIGEWGLSILVETEDARVLLDTGKGLSAVYNADTLGIDLGNVDKIVLSHGHYDHTGGLARLVSECRKANIYLHPGALSSRFSRSSDGSIRSIGMPPRAAESLAERADAVRWTRAAAELHPGIFVTGEIPRDTPPEAPTDRFFLDRECRVPDPFIDDQALVVDTREGAVIFLGCSHAGVGNTLSRALALSRTGKLRAVFGGMHLAEAPQEKLERLADRITLLDPRFIGPGHCTGRHANVYLKNRFSAACTVIRAGMSFKSYEHF